MNRLFDYGGMPGPFRHIGNKIKAVDHGKCHTLATIERGKFTDDAVFQHGKLLTASYELASTLNEFVLDGECYCLNPEESNGRNPCPHCRAKELLERLK